MMAQTLRTPARITGVAIAQSARAVLTGLIPITLIALFGWASAGSGSGNTGDAFRGASLLWLASHHVSMDLTFATTATTGIFSVLPIGLLIVPILTLRGAGLRLAREVEGSGLDRLVLAAGMLAFSYAIFVTTVALLVDSPSVRPRYLEAFGSGLVLALLAGGSRILRITWSTSSLRLLRFLRAGAIGLLLPGVALVIASLIVNADQVLNIVQVLRLGVVSALFVILMALLYLPNAAIWALAYATGIGFGFGNQSLLSPWESTIEAVPTFPLFAALPAEPPSWAPGLPVGVLVVAIVLSASIYGSTDRWLADGLRLVATVLVLGVALAWLSGGSLIGGALAAVGPSLWKFPLVLAVHVLLGYTIGAGIPALFRRFRSRGKVRAAST